MKLPKLGKTKAIKSISYKILGNKNMYTILNFDNRLNSWREYLCLAGVNPINEIDIVSFTRMSRGMTRANIKYEIDIGKSEAEYYLKYNNIKDPKCMVPAIIVSIYNNLSSYWS